MRIETDRNEMSGQLAVIDRQSFIKQTTELRGGAGMSSLSGHL